MEGGSSGLCGQDGQCAVFIQAPDCSDEEECKCGDQCVMDSGGSGVCGEDGQCAVFLVPPACSTTTTTTTPGCPRGCPGPAPMSPSYLCADGSTAGPTCAAPSCTWTIRTCPTTTTTLDPVVGDDNTGSALSSSMLVVAIPVVLAVVTATAL